MKRTISNELLQAKLAESLAVPPQALTPRDVHVPEVPGKALAVIGARRSGKTSFMRQLRAERLAAGDAPDQHLLLSLEDERLTGMTAADLGWLLEEHARLVFPAHASGRTVYLDEVQLVQGWETVVRRLLDARTTRVFISGSSAKLLSREIASGLRGRAMEVLVHPFSFRESLRHAGEEPPSIWKRVTPIERGQLDVRLRGYLTTGGFPEAQGTASRDRGALLKGYVDVMVLRDVIERHGTTNPLALRWLQRHLLSNPGGAFSVSKLRADLRSQGVPVAKDTLHAYLDHLQDAFMVRVLSMKSASERQRMVNPRRAYPVDPGLIALYERPDRTQHGRALETAVVLELERRGYAVEWYRAGNLEVDFYAWQPGKRPLLVQVSLETTSDATWEREVRALREAMMLEATHGQGAAGLLLTLDSTPPLRPLPEQVTWHSATAWLLDDQPERAP